MLHIRGMDEQQKWYLLRTNYKWMLQRYVISNNKRQDLTSRDLYGQVNKNVWLIFNKNIQRVSW